MKFRVRSLNEINTEQSPGFITSEQFDSDYECYSEESKHSMEYYCNKIIDLKQGNKWYRFDGWSWNSDWLVPVIEDIMME